ncbi:MAG: ATP-dependent DNA helicase RecG [Gammaproteobacteria bacterium]
MTHLKGIGPRQAERFARLNIRSVQDLLFHLPLRYQDRTRVLPIGALRLGDEAVIEGEVQLTDVRFGRRRTLLCRVSDGTGTLTLRFFHFSAAQQAALGRGVKLRCFGEVRNGPATLEMVHPEYQRVDALAQDAPERQLTSVPEFLTPIYPATEGVQQLSLRALTGQALKLLHAGTLVLEEWLPAAVLASLQLPSLGEAVAYVHYPPPDAPLTLLEQGQHPAQRRLAFEELLAHHLSLRLLRNQVQRQTAPALDAPGKLIAALLCALPFTLTHAQQRVIGEIRHDLRRATPMQRLVQGDVGSGKTLVAACAILHSVEAGYQTVIMAPTELLAEQHLYNFTQWLAPLNIEVAGLSGKLKGAARAALIANIASGEARVVVGTHALFQEGVSFPKLGLVVIDEQHRFGVHQRLALREKGYSDGRYPHQLIMTATPIPRTLAMTTYADLDISIINELPPGRTPVETVVISDQRRAEIVMRVHNICRAGRQVYWVCTLIEESEVLQCQAATDTATKLAEALPELRVGLVHGRMKAAEKGRMMQDFKAGLIDLLVATTVIEVGVDVPNASLMIIENAERLGLAQLHQLRGRVGRGSEASHCVLMYRNPISAPARERLAALRATNDGFEIARRDLELRGPGEVLGTRQTGVLQLHIADLIRDQDLVSAVESAAALLLQDYPTHVQPLIKRWLNNAAQYGEV